ncbi:hypothetical protein QBC45DRAFT_395583 [Copromyces sp. CBS 386.78]|nr:hypothetical protein QBC45DRAFT_395583 [Copromyces sp. CBS 386.78]
MSTTLCIPQTALAIELDFLSDPEDWSDFGQMDVNADTSTPEEASALREFILIEAGFGTWCYSAPEDRKAWGESMIERLRTGHMRTKGLELGLTTEEAVEEMIEGWKEWMIREDATLGIVNGEVIVRKGGSSSSN